VSIAKLFSFCAFTVTVTVYVPAVAGPAGLIVGFCEVLEKPFGPAQEYVPPPEELKLITLPMHEFEAVIAVGAVALILLMKTY